MAVRSRYDSIADDDGISVRLAHVSKTYRLYRRNAVDRFKDTFLGRKAGRSREFTALKDVSLDIRKGEILGIVGRNGAGKSTLLKLISGISPPSSGSIEVDGRIVPLLELGGGFNPEYSGRENVYFYCSLLGFRKDAIAEIYPKVVEFSELKDFIDIPIKKYSSGMRARLGFAVAVHIDPDILILDEVLSVGDELFKRKCFVRMEEFFDSGKTVLFVSHNARNITDICTRAVLLESSELILDSTPQAVVRKYQQLLNSSGSGYLRRIKQIRQLNGNPEAKRLLEDDLNKSRFAEYEASVITDHDLELCFSQALVPKHAKQKSSWGIRFSHLLLTENGRDPINILTSGKSYRLKFRVKIREPIAEFRIGTAIHDHRSRLISGIAVPVSLSGSNRSPGEAGTFLDVDIAFQAVFSSGLYAVKLSVTDSSALHEKKSQPLALLTDALIFKVIDSAEASGPVNCFSQLSVTKRPGCGARK